ncbi:MAG TPA: hypothetical protein VHI73_03365 [Solirubrobacteraceae bacterium]|jgi:hypothetical protein|nr:hypothetical protein [Solirubrobacteraceae bacterium]
MRQLVLTMVAAAAIGVAAGGCGQGQNISGPRESANTVPAPPAACIRLPNGVAQDGVNDEQGGSVPGIRPCDGPGN